MPSSPHFPLEIFSKKQRQQLCHVLWSWPICDECCDNETCGIDECPFRRTKRLGRFFEYYKDLTSSYESDIKYGESSTLNSHEDLFEIIKVLKTRPDTTRARLSSQLIEIRPVERRTPLIDLERAINLAVRIMIMVNCSTQKTSPAMLENGENKTPWINDISFTQFLTNAFPMTDHPNLNDEDVIRTLDIKSALMAKKLKKRAGLKFQPTDDLKSHLKLDRKNAIVEVYHHTAFLKENLRLTKDLPRNLSVSDTLKLGAIPRQLALETLDSIQKILFPLTDAKSRALLGSLTSTAGFDPDCLRFDSASIRTADEKDIPYHYFGSRLADLYDELENPTPRGIEKWFERKSGARYVMMATLVGVIFAVILGIASLAVSGYQAWISYQQWQHPISVGS